MTLHIFCDNCYTWVHDVCICEQGISCTCGNVLLLELPIKEQKKIKIQIAKAIWNL